MTGTCSLVKETGKRQGPETAEAMPELQGLRIVSFLGTGNYQAVRYHWPERAAGEVETAYVAAALAQLTEASEVMILATRSAEALHGASGLGAEGIDATCS